MPVLQNYVSHRFPSIENVNYFRCMLENAQDERPVQVALAVTPSLLRCLTLNTKDFWCFDRPALGAELVPDFLLCCNTSAGYIWSMVELESPRERPLTKAGRPAVKLREAMGQIDDWRIWLRNNIAYAQFQLGLTGINAECEAWIMIGRRAMIQPAHAAKYSQLSSGPLKIISYDRFLEMIQV